MGSGWKAYLLRLGPIFPNLNLKSLIPFLTVSPTASGSDIAVVLFLITLLV